MEVILSIIGAVGSALGSFAGIMINSKLVNYRIEELEKKVDKHNRVIDRVYRLERKDAVFEEELRATERRLGELEKYCR